MLFRDLCEDDLHRIVQLRCNVVKPGLEQRQKYDVILQEFVQLLKNSYSFAPLKGNSTLSMNGIRVSVCDLLVIPEIPRVPKDQDKGSFMQVSDKLDRSSEHLALFLWFLSHT